MQLGLIVSAPAFLDPDLSVPARIHRLSCPALRDRLCRCGSPGGDLPPGPLTILQKRGDAAQVQHPDFSAVWIEIELLKPVAPRPTRESPHHGEAPSDFLLLERWLDVHGAPSYGRRRRHPHSGEMVWVRAELRDPDQEPVPWRLLSVVQLEGQPTVTLIHPARPGAEALYASWEEVRHLQAPKGAASALLPVFPLPDGTEDPGWKGKRF